MYLKISNFLRRFFVQIILIFYSITVLYLLYVLIVTPFRTNTDVARGLLTIPKSFTLENFIRTWNNGINFGFRNSLIYSMISCFISIIIGGLAGYAFSFIKFRFKNLVYKVTFIGLFISTLLIAIPLFLQYRNFNLLNSIIGILIIYIGIRLPFTVFLFKNFFDDFPRHTIESAKIDGASEITLIVKIVFPLSKAVIFTIFLLNFIAIWNDFLLGLLFLRDADKQVIMTQIVSFFTFEDFEFSMVNQLTQGYAAMFMATVPLLILYTITKRYYVQGITMGGMK